MRYDKSRFGDFENVPQGLFRYAIGTFRNHKTSNSLIEYGILNFQLQLQYQLSIITILNWYYVSQFELVIEKRGHRPCIIRHS